MKEDYNKSSTRKFILTRWRKVINFLQGTDIRLYLIAMKVLGDIYVEFDDYETARNYYNFYKKASFSLGLLEETIYAYEALGNISKFLYKYQKAIKCFKKMIEMAWILKDVNMELRAYDHIGIQYFYLGNKEKARYYHERMIYGITEPDDSKVKMTVVENFKNKHYNFFNDDAEKTMVKRNLSNEHLSQELIEQIRVYSRNDEKVELDNYDIFSNQEIMKNSFISDVDMSFQIIFDKSHDMTKYDDSQTNSKNKNKSFNMPTFNFNDGTADSIRENLENTNNLILSHLSTKRKDYNVERFEGLFKRFDTELKAFLNKKK